MNSSRPSMMCMIRGPILLIALGTLFAIDQSGSYSIWQTWPVLIILFGILKLLERLIGGSGPAPYAPPGGTQ